MSETRKLPAKIWDWNIEDLLKALCHPTTSREIHIDFSTLELCSISGMIAILCRLKDIHRRGVKIFFSNLENRSDVIAYMQRMDFFKQCGIEFPEEQIRHESRQRFVEISEIGGAGGRTDEGNLAIEIANCLVPDQKDSCEPSETGLWDLVHYSISELILNVIQHSDSSGYVGAQFFPQKNWVEIAIADVGVGIRGSFARKGSPLADKLTDDCSAIDLALKPGITCTTHHPYGESPNAGVGLTLMREVALASGGRFSLVSGDGIHESGQTIPKLIGKEFCGTFVNLVVYKNRITNFSDQLYAIKGDLGMLRKEIDLGDVFR